MSCIRNEDCSLTEACIDRACQRPCDLHDPCASNAVCINTNHGTDCSCSEGYQGNGYVGCTPGSILSYNPISFPYQNIVVSVTDNKSVCHYNEDCPPDKLCDRLNRICMSVCLEDSCGDNAECLPIDHAITCQCLPGCVGNPYQSCEKGKI